MEAFRSWSISVGAACIISAVLNFLLPESSIQKSVKFVLSIFTVLVFLLPIKDIDLFDSEYTNGIAEYVSDSELEDMAEKQVIDTLSEQIKGEFSAFLTSEGISEFNIEVDVNIDANKNIFIREIEVCYSVEFKEKDKIIVDFSKNSFGIEPDIIYAEM